MKFLSCTQWFVSLAHRLGKSQFRRRHQRLAVIEQLEPREMLTGFVVTSVADTTDAGTLRWAIGQANSSAGSDTISFDDSFTTAKTIVLNGTELPVLNDTTGITTITGPGTDLLTISGNDLSRIFDIAFGANVSLSGLTVSHGNAGLENGGGIRNLGVLNVSDVVLTENIALRENFLSNDSAVGGSIYNRGLLTISDSSIQNSSANMGGGIGSTGTLVASHVQLLNNFANFSGGGLFTSGATTLQYCLIDHNSAVASNLVEGSGGGIYQSQADVTHLTLFYSTVSNNTATQSGGGIESHASSHIVDSTLNGNHADSGGAIVNNGAMDLANSTLANSSAKTGGAILNFGTLDVTNVTLSGNSATESGAGITLSGYDFTLTNSIVVDNLLNGVADNIDGFTSANTFVGNLIGPSIVSNFPTSLYGNIFLQAGGNAGLGTLGVHGGFTQTIPLLVGSPAIDPTLFPLENPQFYQFDQRGTGFPRFIGTSRDIGAFEADYPRSAITVFESSSFIALMPSLGLTALPLTYTLTGGADQDQFYLQQDGYLAFLTTTDFQHPTDSDSNNTYLVQITATDANGQTATQDLTVTVVDYVHKPELGQTYGAGTYHLGGAPVTDPGLTFTADPSVTDYSAAKLNASFDQIQPKDALKIVSQGTGAGQISVKKNKISFGCMEIGSFTGGTKKDPNLVISFNTATTEAAVQALARQIGFSTKNKHLPQASRWLKMQIVNLYGQHSDPSMRRIDVVAKTK